MTIQSLFSEVETLKNQNSGLFAQLSLKEERLKFYEKEVSFLHEVIRELKRSKFGKKSERWETEEQLCFNEAELLQRTLKPEVEAEVLEDQPEGVVEVEVKAHVQKRGKRKPLPKELPREVVVVELPEEERLGSNGQPMRPIGKEVSEKLHYEPSRLSVIETHRIRYGEDSGDTGVVAPVPPSIVPKSYVTSGLLAEIVVKKYLYALPLYRLEDMFLRMGIEIPRQTQARWIIEAAEQLIPLINLLQERLLSSPYLAIDETWTQVLKEKNRTPEAKSWM